jgi:YHS domain-containing protein
MRAVGVLLWILTVGAILLPAFRHRLAGLGRGRPAPVRDELVKDPVCQTYVVRSRAVQRRRDGEPVYFCSTRCASRWA